MILTKKERAMVLDALEFQIETGKSMIEFDKSVPGTDAWTARKKEEIMKAEAAAEKIRNESELSYEEWEAVKGALFSSMCAKESAQEQCRRCGAMEDMCSLLEKSIEDEERLHKKVQKECFNQWRKNKIAQEAAEKEQRA